MAENSNNTHVLLIEDNEGDYIITKELLSQSPDQSFELDWISSPKQGLATLIKNSHDICLIDYQLGAVSGIDIVQEARNRGFGALLNSNALDPNLGGRIDRDKLGFLHNPSIDIDDLTNSVEQLVRDASPWAGDFKLGTSTVAMDSDDMSEEDMGKAVLYTLNSFSELSGGNVKFGSLSEGCKDMLADTVSWQQRIKRTIADESFTLVYQPIVNLADGKIHHYETLTRLNDDPEASPYKFITMAEQLGKIAEFDWAVMQRAFKTLRNADAAEAIPIAVNISGLSLSTPELVSSVTSILKLNTDLKDLILFEVTESSNICVVCRLITSRLTAVLFARRRVRNLAVRLSNQFLPYAKSLAFRPSRNLSKMPVPPG